jgi:hypothetical protein
LGLDYSGEQSHLSVAVSVRVLGVIDKANNINRLVIGTVNRDITEGFFRRGFQVSNRFVVFV